MTSSVNLVRASVDHVDAVAPLYDRYRRFYQQGSDPVGARSFLWERLSKNQSVIFLARVNGEDAGFVQLYPSFSSISMKPLWILNDLFVAEEFRRRGVGEALLQRAREWGIETGAKELMLQTALDNAAAQRLYERLGWQRDTTYCVYELMLPPGG